jgi:hypothetical protein
MLKIIINGGEDNPAELQFEHSLASLSKWESIHQKPFFRQGPQEPLSEEEARSYFEEMLLTENPPENWLDKLSATDVVTINEYINSKQSATWFREEKNKPGPREIITTELVYYWMIQFNIPFACETWHFNRLMTLIQICGIRQAKPRKMSRAAQMEEMRRLNAERRQQLGTAG